MNSGNLALVLLFTLLVGIAAGFFGDRYTHRNDPEVIDTNRTIVVPAHLVNVPAKPVNYSHDQLDSLLRAAGYIGAGETTSPIAFLDWLKNTPVGVDTTFERRELEKNKPIPRTLSLEEFCAALKAQEVKNNAAGHPFFPLYYSFEDGSSYALTVDTLCWLISLAEPKVYAAQETTKTPAYVIYPDGATDTTSTQMWVSVQYIEGIHLFSSIDLGLAPIYSMRKRSQAYSASGDYATLGVFAGMNAVGSLGQQRAGVSIKDWDFEVNHTATQGWGAGITKHWVIFW